MGLLRWMRLRKTYESVKEINIKTIKNFIIAIYNKNFGKWKKEQADWRLGLVKENSIECFNKEECFCGCDLKSLLYQPFECSEKGKCFPKWMTKKQWIKFKNQKYAFNFR